MPVRSDIQIITAPSVLGLKLTGVEGLASTLLSAGLQSKLRADSPVVDVATLNHLYKRHRHADQILNADSLNKFSINLSNTILQQPSDKFLLILGGDCSILLGIMSALRLRGNYGLFFLDAHADFYEPEKSVTGEAADMDLALVTGRGPDILTNIHGVRPYVRDENIVHLGQRDAEETNRYNSRDIRETNITCFDASFIHLHGVQGTNSAISEKLNQTQLDGFWIHFDTDVIDDESNPAVDYRLPGGLSFEESRELLNHLITNYNIAGMSVTIFNPTLDPYGKIVRRLTSLLTDVLT